MIVRRLQMLLLATALVPTLAAAQAPPAAKSPPAASAPAAPSRDCANLAPPPTDGRSGDVDVSKPDGSNLSRKLAQSNGVLCPPEQVDPGMRAPTPPGGRMPVIKPPGTPGSPDQSVQPK